MNNRKITNHENKTSGRRTSLHPCRLSNPHASGELHSGAQMREILKPAVVIHRCVDVHRHPDVAIDTLLRFYCYCSAMQCPPDPFRSKVLHDLRIHDDNAPLHRYRREDVAKCPGKKGFSNVFGADERDCGTNGHNIGLRDTARREIRSEGTGRIMAAARWPQDSCGRNLQ